MKEDGVGSLLHDLPLIELPARTAQQLGQALSQSTPNYVRVQAVQEQALTPQMYCYHPTMPVREALLRAVHVAVLLLVCLQELLHVLAKVLLLVR